MIKPLTSLRFIFALLVFLSHTGSYLIDNENYKWFYDKFLYEGYLGVSFFFILSGFILALNYKDKFLLEQTNSIKFWIARVTRICPLYFLTFLISIPVSINFLVQAKLLTIVSVTFSHLFILHSFIPFKVFYFNFNSPSWSISNEMFFYLLFPFLIFLFYKIKKKHFFLLYTLIIPITLFWINEEDLHALIYINPFFRLIDFILGIFLYDIFLRIKSKQWIIKNATLIELSVIGIFLLFYLNHGTVYQPLRYSVYYWIPMLLIILIFAFQKGILSKFLSQRIFYLLGEISFGFYLFHILIFKYFELIFGTLWVQNNSLVFITMSFLATLIISYLTFEYFEKPLNIIFKKKLLNHRLFINKKNAEISYKINIKN